MTIGLRTCTLAVATLGARVAWASEEAHAHAAGIPWATLLFSTINLLIFMAILARFVMPAARDLVRQRRTRVVSLIEAATTAKAEAERLRDEWQKRLGQLDSEIETLRARARADAERERDRILESARQTAKAIRRDAERAAAYEVRRVQDLLRAELAREATRLAGADVRATWTSADQATSVADFMKQVQR